MTFLLSVVAAGSVAVPAAAASSSHAQQAGGGNNGTAVSHWQLPAGEQLLCPPAKPGQMSCQAIIRRASAAHAGFASPALAPQAQSAYGPAQLRSAYNLVKAAVHRGKGKTVAIVDAFRNPNAAKDLAVYRKHFHLAPCTIRNHCLRIVNQNGRTGHLPKANTSWAHEISLDLDMVSAICPHCHILLVETNSDFTNSLGTGVNTAQRHARFVSNSWSGQPFRGSSAFNHFFNHKGKVIAFASGDFGSAVAYPTELRFVTAVGGTSLFHTASHGRKWTETVWNGTGGGCSGASKPSWQHDRKCHGRTENDVAAEADPNTGVWVYDSYKTNGEPWRIVGGTSAATPIITAIYALAGNPGPAYPSAYPYRHKGKFFDITAGSNGSCRPVRRYLCHGGKGYDAPTGVGTPNGWAGLHS